MVNVTASMLALLLTESDPKNVNEVRWMYPTDRQGTIIGVTAGATVSCDGEITCMWCTSCVVRVPLTSLAFSDYIS